MINLELPKKLKAISEPGTSGRGADLPTHFT